MGETALLGDFDKILRGFFESFKKFKIFFQKTLKSSRQFEGFQESPSIPHLPKLSCLPFPPTNLLSLIALKD